jgi:hypothetical protein
MVVEGAGLIRFDTLEGHAEWAKLRPIGVALLRVKAFNGRKPSAGLRRRAVEGPEINVIC